jgi:hypothetical protein
MLAQSIGGGGGSGGSSTSAGSSVLSLSFNAGLGAGLLNLGSRAGSAGNGGAVLVDIDMMTLRTKGFSAAALVAQSIGGGGGVSGSTDVISGPLSSIAKLGGASGMSGNGGEVIVDTRSVSLNTQKAGSSAVIAQSIGGGGGLSLENATSRSDRTALTVDYKLGQQSGGGGGTGGAVTVLMQQGRIETGAALSNGIVAQSIGGGGGISQLIVNGAGSLAGTLHLGAQASMSAANGGGAVTVDLKDTSMQINGVGSAGIVAQSIGRGGGIATAYTPDLKPLAAVTLGSAGASTQSNGGAVVVKDNSSITLSGGFNFGVVAQSIGGGGGFSPLAAASVTLGSTAATGVATGGTVTLEATPRLIANGANSIGIVAQSIGGGGGLVVSSGSIAIGGAKGAQSNGGTVYVNVTQQIDMYGASSIGVLAQSVGGGGGFVLGTSTASAPRFVPGSGTGGIVDVNVNAPIYMWGSNSVGVIAQAPNGGGGGALTGSGLSLGWGGGPSGPRSSHATVNVNKDVIARGTGSIAVKVDGTVRAVVTKTVTTQDPLYFGAAAIAAAAGAAAEDDAEVSSVHIAPGVTVIGGSGDDSAGILIDSAQTELVIGEGAIVTTEDLRHGNAITATNGNVDIKNAGIIGGNILFDSASSGVFANAANGAFLAFDRISLGAGGQFTNAGTLDLGGLGVQQTTYVTGSVSQLSTGRLLTDLDLGLLGSGQFTDRLEASGTSRVAGTVVAVETNVASVTAGNRTSTLVRAAQGLTDGGVALLAPRSAIADFSVGFSITDLQLRANVDFATVGRVLNVNRTATGDYFNAIQSVGSSAALAGTVQQLFYTPDATGLAQTYDTYSGGIYADQLAAAIYAADRFTARMTACPSGGLQTRGGCAWLSGGGTRLRLDSSVENHRFRENGSFLQGGLEHRLGETALVAGISGSYESSKTRVNGAYGRGDRYQVGVMLGWRPAQAELTLYGTLGTGSMNVLRPVATPGGASVASGRQRFGFGQYGVVAGYNFGISALTIRPAIEAGYAHYIPGGFTEGGAGPLDLTASAGTSAGVGFVRPQLSVAGRLSLGATVIEPYLGGSYTRRFSDRVSFRSGFVGAPQGAGDFAVARFVDQDSGQLRAGVTANTRHGLRLTGEYSVTAGRRTLDQALQAKVSLEF